MTETGRIVDATVVGNIYARKQDFCIGCTAERDFPDCDPNVPCPYVEGGDT